MKAIKITKANQDRIEAELRAVNGRATSFTVRELHELGLVEQRAEDRLTALPKKDWVGVQAIYEPAGPSAKSYKYAALSTRVTIERRKSGWFLTDVKKAEVRPQEREMLALNITQAQADKIAAKALAGFNISQT